jgi:hypothetical protein
MSAPTRNAERRYADYRALAEEYEREPSIENYVRFKRTFGAIIGVGIAVDPISIEPELRQFGIDPSLVSQALDGDEYEIDELALKLMERLIERKKLEERGTTHVQSRQIAISDSLVNYLIVASLEALEENEASIPSSLVRLIRDRLCGAHPDRYTEFIRLQRRRDAVAMAAIKFPTGKVSIRRIAALMDVEPSTISRWFPDGDFQEHVDRFRVSIDAFGLRSKFAGGFSNSA